MIIADDVIMIAAALRALQPQLRELLRRCERLVDLHASARFRLT